MRFAVVGPGRAGGSFRDALVATGAHPIATLGRGDDPAELDPSVDLVIIAVPDRAIADVARRLPRGPLVVHLSGATDLAPLLAFHERCGSFHPLLSLPDPERGARALMAKAHVAIAAPSSAIQAELEALADRLGARWFVVDDDRRASYHAAASIAANHLVALLAQVERIARAEAIPLRPFTEMMRAVIDNVEDAGATASLTGPVARGDWDTVRAHLASIDPDEHRLYVDLARACAALAGHRLPPDLMSLDDGSADNDMSDPPPTSEVTR
jgi:predicted short-subunit dehydrogenase-like oxidoreductase (DUF2520 family)